ncbi:hypothetical protein GO755_31475 [Spirosoma sp. HMF4905]|uniref:DUF1493 family protein n=1 Tax=Spirosoma arboris TaxID=2682092 RepID=A0A7K1SLA1_9BACT|nr:hypothetical protein [Spirosoma arboris]MVM34592.1 hypothetical protein [Spirosoma arboris]
MTVHERQELKEMIEYEIGGQIPENPIFFDDLGIGGDDCIELMHRIAVKYGIEMTSYSPRHYHETEQEAVMWPFVKVDRPFKEFDFNHLIDVIDQKRWYEPNPSA